jgi:hypothetical protein
MNIETREIKDLNDLSPAEKASGKWIPVAKKYVQKQPITDADFARIEKAHARWQHRLAKRAREFGNG